MNYSSGGDNDSKILANIDGVKASGYTCGESSCGAGSTCYCCETPVGEKCIYGDLQSCQLNCHAPKYPRKFLQWFGVIIC